MADFYDHPVTGKLFFRAPAGGGNSVFDGPATEADIRNHPHDHDRYRGEKLRIATEAAAAKAEADALSALKTEAASVAEHIATIETNHKEA